MVREPSHAQNDIHRTDFQTVKLPASRFAKWPSLKR
jgi:hypothetical protein